MFGGGFAESATSPTHNQPTPDHGEEAIDSAASPIKRAASGSSTASFASASASTTHQRAAYEGDDSDINEEDPDTCKPSMSMASRPVDLSMDTEEASSSASEDMALDTEPGLMDSAVAVSDKDAVNQERVYLPKELPSKSISDSTIGLPQDSSLAGSLLVSAARQTMQRVVVPDVAYSTYRAVLYYVSPRSLHDD